VDAEVAAGTTILWRSRATFTPTGARPRPTPERARSHEPRPEPQPFPDDAARRSLELTADALRAYSRSGNFHSDPDEARRLGMPGLVAQGMQVCGPAYGLLLDAWGAEFLHGGRLTARFVGMVVDGQTIDAAVVHDDERARFEVRDEAARVVAFGTARRTRRSNRAR
jgi:acyl dehydratase